MINEANINYRLSLHILNTLKKNNLITQEEFEAIDLENKNPSKHWNIKFDLINAPSDYIM